MSRTIRTSQVTFNATRDGEFPSTVTIGDGMSEVWNRRAVGFFRRQKSKANRRAAKAVVAEELSFIAVMEQEDKEQEIIEHNRQLDAEWAILQDRIDAESERLAAHVEAQDALWRAENPAMPWRLDQDKERLEWAHAFMARHADDVFDYWTWQQDAESEHDAIYGKDVVYAEQSDRQAVRRLLELEAPLEP